MAFDFSGYTEQQAMDMMYPKQLEAYKTCRFGTGDILITASGGSGKSFIIDALSYFSKHNTVATGLSGVAAVNVSGATLHSTVSLPLGIPTRKDMKNTGKRYKSLFKRQHPVSNLIIDEMSMCGPETFDSLLQRRERISKTAKSKYVRLLMFCDFFQLPNVVKGNQYKDLLIERYGSTKLLGCAAFQKMIEDGLQIFELDQNMRSGEDKVFSGYLEDVRQGQNIEEALKYFNTKVGEPETDAVFLTTTNAIADKINEEVFNANPNLPYYFYAKVKGNFPAKDSKLPEVIIMKEGLRVMSLFNDPEGEDLYVNGSVGTVVACMESSVEVAFDNGNTCWIEYCKEEKKEYYTDSDNELQSKVVATFENIGLRQCSAVSIHKAQGIGLDKATLDVSDGAFAYGQVYVGLSRLTNPEGLTLTAPIQVQDVKVDVLAKKFYASLRGETYDASQDTGFVPAEYRKYKIRLIIAGGRKFEDFSYVQKSLNFMLQNYKKDEILIIEGGATGADRLGRRYAELNNIDYVTMVANWKDLETPPVKIKENNYGSYNCLAGLSRNKRMGDLASHAVVYWDGVSTGSKHMQEYMEDLKKPVKVFRY